MEIGQENEQGYEGLESVKQQIIKSWDKRDYPAVIEGINLYYLLSGNHQTAQTLAGDLEEALK